VAAVAEILADIESELRDFTANCVTSPCTQENALRTFIQRRIMHELERQEETAQKISCCTDILSILIFQSKMGRNR
jgi:TorA maturation chaperone TorD